MNYTQDYRCDYVTLFIKDAENNSGSDMANGKCVWDIPESAYYYKDRSSITVMSVPSASMSKLLLDNIIMMSPIGFNNSCSQLNSNNATRLNSSLGVIGSFVGHNKPNNTNTFEMRYINTSPIYTLVPSQPNKVEINFIKDDKSFVDLSTADTGGQLGSITLKFDYHKPNDYKPVEDEFNIAFAPQSTF